jgi:hypothetical protein
LYARAAPSSAPCTASHGLGSSSAASRHRREARCTRSSSAPSPSNVTASRRGESPPSAAVLAERRMYVGLRLARALVEAVPSSFAGSACSSGDAQPSPRARALAQAPSRGGTQNGRQSAAALTGSARSFSRALRCTPRLSFPCAGFEGYARVSSESVST